MREGHCFKENPDRSGQFEQGECFMGLTRYAARLQGSGNRANDCCPFFPRSVYDGSCTILVHVQDVENEREADDMARVQSLLQGVLQLVHR
jgi:hypothetical protein